MNICILCDILTSRIRNSQNVPTGTFDQSVFGNPRSYISAHQCSVENPITTTGHSPKRSPDAELLFQMARIGVSLTFWRGLRKCSRGNICLRFAHECEFLHNTLTLRLKPNRIYAANSSGSSTTYGTRHRCCQSEGRRGENYDRHQSSRVFRSG